MIAQAGLPHEKDMNIREKNLESVLTALIDASASLSGLTGAFADRPGRDLDWIRQKTPLAIAAHKRSSFPKHMLHLLAKSYQTPDESQPLSEVFFIALTNPAAAEHLMTQVKGNSVACRSLLHEVNGVPR